MPKGFVNLREAIEAIGKAGEPDWTGAEQVPENWELLDGPHVQKERWGQLWLQVMGNALAIYGLDVFERAAVDYWFDSRGHPDDDADLERFIPIYEEQTRKLFGAIHGGTKVEMLHATRRIHLEATYLQRDAKRAELGYDRRLTHRFHCSPPTIEGDEGPEVITLDGRKLEKWEKGVDAFLRDREAERSQLRERVERVWKRLRPEFHDRPQFGEGDKCVVLDDRGEILPVPAGIWGLPEAETLLRDCAFDKREIFMREDLLEAALYVHFNPKPGLARRLRERQARLSVGAGSGVETSPEAKPESDERVAGPAAPAAPRKRSAPGRPNKGVVAAETYRRVFPDGHEDLGHSWDSAIAEITNNGAPKVSKRTLRRGLEKLRKQKI